MRLLKNGLGLVFIVLSCQQTPTVTPPETVTKNWPSHITSYAIRVANYFEFMDSLVAKYDSLLPYSIDEYAIVHHNQWIIDSLEHTDYYYQMERGNFVEDQKKMVVIPKNTPIELPTEKDVQRIHHNLENTVIDLNIPTFTMRIIENDSVIHSFPVRVGRNEIKYLAMAGRNVDLRTHAGEGTIIRIDKNPVYINPVNNLPYKETKRDDLKTTKLPRIPWLEPEVNGIKYGQLIHPTTNPETLGKAYSNGCIGTTERDMWRLYYHAPVGTKVVIRYDLKVVNEEGDTLVFPDIYPPEKLKRPVPKDTTSVAGIQNQCQCVCGYL